MILRRFLATIGIIAALAAGSHAAFAQGRKPAAAPAAEDAFHAAFLAYRAGDAIKLARNADLLDGHVLQPYAEYWRIKLRLEDAGSPEVRTYLA